VPPEIRPKRKEPGRLTHSVLLLLLAVVVGLGLVLAVSGVAGGQGSQAGAGFPGAAEEVSRPQRDPFVVGTFSGPGRERPAPAMTTGGQQAQERALPRRDPFAAGQKDAGGGTPPGAGGPPVSPPVAEKVEVRVTTLDLCWLEVYVDGRQALRKNVPGATTHTWVGEREVLLQQVGREWAVNVVVNGQDLGRLTGLAARLQRGPQTVQTDGTRVKITLARRYWGGVLVGVKFSLQE